MRGGGLAVPHAHFPGLERIVGVVGIARQGLAFETPDDKPVHCVVLLATPEGQSERHIQILGMLARTIGSDPVVQTQLFNAKSPAHAYEILHKEKGEDFNYFLES